jgi:hypothetical protein
MLNPELQQEIVRREGDAASRVTEGADPHSEDSWRDALWQNWLTTTAQLQEFGFSPNTLCEGVNNVAEIRHQFEEAREHVT